MEVHAAQSRMVNLAQMALGTSCSQEGGMFSMCSPLQPVISIFGK